MDASRRLLNFNSTCKCIVNQSPLTFPYPPLPTTQVTGIAIRNFTGAACTAGSDIAVATPTRPPQKAWIQEIKLANMTVGPIPDSVIADVVFTFDKALNSTILGPSVITREIQGLVFNVSRSGAMATIIDCGSSGSGSKALLAGTINTPGGCTGSGSVAVAFPPGRFSTIPSVVITPGWYRITSDEDTTWKVTGISTNGFTATWAGPGGGSCPGTSEYVLHWMAMEP